MAVVKGKFIIGAVGPVIYKIYRGQQVITGKARGTVKISAETIKSATTFGKASSFATQLRRSVSQIVTSNYDGTMPHRLTRDIVRILIKGHDPETGTFYFNASSFEALRGFQFNIKSPFDYSLLELPYVSVSDDRLTLHLPEINVPKHLKFPPKATSCNISFSMVEFNLLDKTRKVTLLGSTIIANVKSVIPAQEWKATVMPGWFSVIAMSLNFVQRNFTGDVALNTKEYCPAMIVSAGFIAAVDRVGPFTLQTGTYRTVYYK